MYGFAAWDEAFPDRKQRVLQPFEPIDHPFVEIARFESRIPGAVFTERGGEAGQVSVASRRLQLDRHRPVPRRLRPQPRPLHVAEQ